MLSDPAHNLSLEELDKRAFLHPFTQLADHKKTGPRIMAKGSGVHVWDSHGRRYIDGAAGLWCVNVGYGRAEIVEEIREQASRLPFFHSFSSMSNEPAIRLSNRILGFAPQGMSKVFFGNSGSDANDTNVKLVWYYNNLRGKPKKKKIISRQRGYHGVTVAAGSLTGLPMVHDAFDLPIPQVLHTRAPDIYRDKPAGFSDQDFARQLAAEIDALVKREGPETVAAFIAEPVMGTGGVLLPPEQYFQEIRNVLDRHDMLMIADEVICGFGRLGSWFGCQHYGIRPDLMTIAKGLTSGYLPMSASVLSEEIWEVISNAPTEIGPFGHGYTYSGHPVAAAAALANIDILENEKLIDVARVTGAIFKRRLRETFADHPLVGDIRCEGLMAGVELVADKANKTIFDPSLKVGPRVMKQGYEEGVIVRALPHGSTIAISPPLVITLAEIEELLSGLKKSLDTIVDQLVREGDWRDRNQ